MTLKRNILANYVGAGAVAFAPLFALPWYLAALGPKQFGLIGFIVMLQAVLSLVDAGMSQALVREITTRLDSPAGDRHRAAVLLFGFERIYWLFALCSGCALVLLADVIAMHWLNLEDLPIELGKGAVYGAAVIFAVQFPGSIYRSVLVGAQAQVILSGILLGGALARHIGGVIIIFFWPTLSAYLIWHALIAMLETLIRSRYAWSALDTKRSAVSWEMEELRSVWKLVVSMSGAAWLGALTVQMDKIVLSRSASIDQFGYYVIASTVAVGALQAVYPLVQAVLPRAIQLRTEPLALRVLSIKLIWIIGLPVGCVAIVFIAAGKSLLQSWLKNPEAAHAVHPILTVLLIGSAINALYNVGYINWLVNGKIYRVFQVNALALALSMIFIPLLVALQGSIGAAFGWLVINSIGFVFSLEWLKGKKQDERKY